MSGEQLEAAAKALQSSREFQAAAAFGVPEDAYVACSIGMARAVLDAGHPSVSTVAELEAATFQTVIWDGRLPLVKGKYGDWHGPAKMVDVRSKWLADVLPAGKSYTVLRWGQP